jgi:hypothetical protein
VAVSPRDDLHVQEPAVLQADVTEGPSVPVLPGRTLLVLQPNPLPFDRPAGECPGLLAEVLNGFLGVDGLGRVDTDQVTRPTAV